MVDMRRDVMPSSFMRATKARYRESCKVKPVEMRATTLELRQKERRIELMTCSESNMLARHDLSYKLMPCDGRISCPVVLFIGVKATG